MLALRETIETPQSSHLTIPGWSLDLGGAAGVALYILGVVGEVLMLISIYPVMPVVRVRFRHALILFTRISQFKRSKRKDIWIE